MHSFDDKHTDGCGVLFSLMDNNFVVFFGAAAADNDHDNIVVFQEIL